MKKKKNNSFGCAALIVYSIPVILILSGILAQYLSLSTLADVKKATASTPAQVVSEEKKIEYDTTKEYDDPDREKLVRYVTIEYTIDGEKHYKTGKSDLAVGETLTAYYDPDDTERVFIEDFDDFGGEISVTGIILTAAGIALLLFFIVYSKKSKQPKTSEQNLKE